MRQDGSVKHSSLRVIGSNVRALRTARGLSQEQLAEVADLHRNYISGIECGVRNVSALNLCAIAEALDCGVGDLFKGVSARPRASQQRRIARR
jgi:transcriptional regulator with XRE-family HTH domain